MGERTWKSKKASQHAAPRCKLALVSHSRIAMVSRMSTAAGASFPPPGSSPLPPLPAPAFSQRVPVCISPFVSHLFFLLPFSMAGPRSYTNTHSPPVMQCSLFKKLKKSPRACREPDADKREKKNAYNQMYLQRKAEKRGDCLCEAMARARLRCSRMEV